MAAFDGFSLGESIAEFFPKIRLAALLGKVSPELSAFTLGSANAWGIAAEGTGSLFEGGRLMMGVLSTERAIFALVRVNTIGKKRHASTSKDEQGLACKRTCSFIHLDDNADDLFFVRHVAERSGLPVNLQQFDSAVRFLEYLSFPDALSFRTPAFLLLDFHLKEMEAPEIITRVRALPVGKSIPIIIYSGSDDIGDAMRAYETGANHFLTKSADLSRLKLILTLLYCGAVAGRDFNLLAVLPEYRMPVSNLLPSADPIVRRHRPR